MRRTNQSTLVEAAISMLLAEKRFYGEFLLNIKYHLTRDPNRCPTAGVYITDTINIIINTHWWNQFDERAQAGVLQHEIDHVLNEHFSRSTSLVSDVKSNMHRLNIAADLAINEFNDNIPLLFKSFDSEGNVTCEESIPCTVSLYNEENPNRPPLERYKNMEYYYEKLKEYEGEGEGEGSSTLDDHSQWGKGSASSEITKEVVKDALKRTIENISPGSVPKHLREYIDSLFSSVVDWKQVLKNFIARGLKVTKQSTRMKRNRRHGIMFPGKKKIPRIKLAILLDTSASMTDAIIAQCFAEVKKIAASLPLDVSLIQCDVEATEPVDFHRGTDKLEVVGRGGTYFQPAFDMAAKVDPDLAIYFTDGANGDTAQVRRPRFPVLWALPEGCEKYLQYDWGKRVTIPNENIKKAG